MLERLRWNWVGAALVAAALFLTAGRFRTLWRQKKALREREQALAALQADNRRLATQIERLEKDPQLIEQIARRELGYIQPGEIEYRFVMEADPPTSKTLGEDSGKRP